MEAFFFGPSTAQLLGVYHPANPERNTNRAVLLCYPFGQEYMRAHRAFRQLANSLAKNGLHVLRFDYRGTGDSACDLYEVNCADWLQDIETAIQELKDMSGVSKVTLVGLRLGGLLAGTVAARNRAVSSLVVWDPVINAGDYLIDLRQQAASASHDKRESNFIDSEGGVHFNGFCMSSSFQKSMSDLNLQKSKPVCSRTLQVASHENQEFLALKNAWSGLGGYEYRLVPAAHDWNYVDHVGGILLPQPILQAMADWI